MKESKLKDVISKSAKWFFVTAKNISNIFGYYLLDYLQSIG
jgi:hypothetical protein